MHQPKTILKYSTSLMYSYMKVKWKNKFQSDVTLQFFFTFFTFFLYFFVFLFVINVFLLMLFFSSLIYCLLVLFTARMSNTVKTQIKSIKDEKNHDRFDVVDDVHIWGNIRWQFANPLNSINPKTVN